MKPKQPTPVKAKISADTSFRSAFAERLKRAAGKHEIGDLAARIGVTPATLYRWFSAKFDPSLPKLAQLADAMQVSLAWLVTGAGPIDSRQALRHALLAEYGAPGFEPAGGKAQKSPIAFHEPWLFELLFGTPENPTLSGAADTMVPLLIEVREDSMEPTIAPGDLLLVDRSFGTRPTGRPYDGIYAFRSRSLLGGAEESTGHSVVRRVQFRLDATMVIRCDNPRYPEEVYPPKARNRPRPLGRVVWRGGRI